MDVEKLASEVRDGELAIIRIDESVAFDPSGIGGAAWKLIYPGVKSLADSTNGEYGAHNIFASIERKRLILFMAFMVDEGMSAVEKNAKVRIGLAKGEGGDFVGFFLTYLDEAAASVHIAQLHIEEKFRNGKVFSQMAKFIIDMCSSNGVSDLTFSSNKPEWGAMAEKLGFKSNYTIYRKRLKE